MSKNRIYLDNCCYNRPYDDQVFETIRLETEAKLFIQEKIKLGKLTLVWSFILDFENSLNPYEEQKESIKAWKLVASIDVRPEEIIRLNANKLEQENNIKPKDALHIACTLKAECDYFVSSDKTLLKKTLSIRNIITLNPIDFILRWEEQ